VPGKTNETESNPMMDVIYIGVVVLFFVVGGLYVRLCEKM
jgi:hypothetical protein